MLEHGVTSVGFPNTAYEGAFVQMPALSPINVEWLGPLPALDEPARDLALDTSAERHGHNPDYGQHQHRLGSTASSSWPNIRLSRCSVPRQLYLPVGVNQFCRFTSSAWSRCWAALVRWLGTSNSRMTE